MEITEGGLDDWRVQKLLEHHFHSARGETAPGSAHALDLQGLKSPEISFWSAWDGETVIGVGALKRLSESDAEIKSMHTVESFRGKGIGRAMLGHIVSEARRLKISRLYLETGSWPYFAPARGLYLREGFVECPPFGSHVADPNSVFMMREIRDESPAYADIISSLKSSYDRNANSRNLLEKSTWKLAERDAFLARLQAEGKSRLLELGAGTGQDSLFFRDHGLDVFATDLSPAMVAMCQANGLNAHEMDVLNLAFPPASFDAAYAFNCLLHVPNRELDAALLAIERVLAPGALLFLGVYSGEDFEGYLKDDSHEPPRFFSFRTDETLLRSVRRYFDLIDFHAVPLDGWRFQSLTLRRRRESGADG